MACCVPECNQKGVESLTGKKSVVFRVSEITVNKKQWIHAIRRAEGKDWQITRNTKVCSLHFRSKDLRKPDDYMLLTDGVPSRFA